jgi:alpha-galactosidase
MDGLVSAGARADVPVRVSYEEVHGAVAMQATVTGPGAPNAAFVELVFDRPDVMAWTARGGAFELAYPPRAFLPEARVVSPRLPFAGSSGVPLIEFGSVNGRGSDGDLPFFLLTDLDGEQGMWVALGWTGGWRAQLTCGPGASRHVLSVRGPGSGAELTLAAGEELVLPRVFMGAFQGDGWGALKGFLSRARPRPQAAPWVVYNTWYNENGRINEERLLAHVPVAAEIGVEVFCVDATWYETGDDPDDFETAGIGTWSVDARKFPRGLEPVADAVREAGMAFGLWFEPERAHPDSWVARTHPEWVRWAPDQQWGLVDFGVEAARSWVLELLSSAVGRWHLGWLKWDMNIHRLAPYWAGDDRAELAHHRGVWDVLDEFGRRHPDVVVEWCASGGNRIDVESLLRCDTFWLTDHTMSPDMVCAVRLNALRMLPAQYCYLALSPQGADGAAAWADEWPDEWFVGNMAGVFGIMDRLSEWPTARREQAASHIDTFKATRHLLDGTFTRFVGGDEVPHCNWQAWELAESGSGGPGGAALFALRMRSREAEMEFSGQRSWRVALPDEGAVVVTACD